MKIYFKELLESKGKDIALILRDIKTKISNNKRRKTQ